MNKLALLKKVGGAALRVARSQMGGGDRVGRLEAQKELLELKVSIMRDTLTDLRELLQDGQAAKALEELNELFEVLEHTEKATS